MTTYAFFTESVFTINTYTYDLTDTCRNHNFIICPIPRYKPIANNWPQVNTETSTEWCHQFNLHLCFSTIGPRQHADIPHAISLKSMWLSTFSSNAPNNPGKRAHTQTNHTTNTFEQNVISK